MHRGCLISGRLAQIFLGAASVLVPALAGAQTPWAVTLTPTLDPLPIGLCAAIHLTVRDATGKDAPRNALGARVTIADFDITVTGSGVVANRIDASHWESCACQSAVSASTATVTASYPSRSLAANATVPGVTLQRAATFTIAAAKGGINPPACKAAAAPVSPAPPAGTLPQPLGVPAIARTPAAPPSAPAAGATLPPTAPPVVLGVPINPSGFTAVQIAPGQVRLSWQAVKGASFYGLFGPGLTAGGEKIVGATSFTATNVPAGNQQWAVGSFIDPGNISTIASEFPRVSLNVTAAAPPAPPATTPPPPAVTTGRYRVVATRFSVGRETIDDLLGLDGKGDEIYGGFSLFHVNRVNGQVLDQDLRRTKVHGQVIAGTPRFVAGSATSSGGLIGGDSYPTASSSAPGGDQTFPFLVWDGTLTNNQDALVLLPSLWESDNDDENFDEWFLSEKNALPVFWWDADMRTALTTLGLNVVTTDTFATGFGFNGLLPLTSKDRPVGLTLRPTGFSLRRRAIVLTREILEAALTPAPASPGESQTDELSKMVSAWNQKFGLAGSFATTPEASAPGKTQASQESQENTQLERLEQPIRARPGESTIAVPLVDDSTPNLRGSYILFLRVERVP